MVAGCSCFDAWSRRPDRGTHALIFGRNCLTARHFHRVALMTMVAMVAEILFLAAVDSSRYFFPSVDYNGAHQHDPFLV